MARKTTAAKTETPVRYHRPRVKFTADGPWLQPPNDAPYFTWLREAAKQSGCQCSICQPREERR